MNNFFAKKYLSYAIGLLAIIMVSCNKNTETIEGLNIKEYTNFKVGNVYIYKADSTVTINFGADTTVRFYHRKDSIASSFIDNTGKNNFLVYTSIKPIASNSWKNAGSYYILVEDDKIEYVENNLRVINLKNVISSTTTWKGNVYINTQSNPEKTFMDGWQFNYIDIAKPYPVAKGLVDSTITVQQYKPDNDKPFDPNAYYDKVISKEVYGKNIGLIYKQIAHFTWQPTPTPGRFQDDGFGVRLSLLEFREK